MAPRLPALQPAKSTLGAGPNLYVAVCVTLAWVLFGKCTVSVVVTSTPYASAAKTDLMMRWPRKDHPQLLLSGPTSPTQASEEQ